MGNSVLDALDYGDEIGEKMLSISGYCSCDKFSVLVEGPDDVIVYEKFFSKDKVEVYCMNGCNKLLDVVKSLDEKGDDERFIAIKDADYDRLNGKVYPYSNLFLTDAHDLETTIIDGEILESILKEYLKYEDMKRNHIQLDGNHMLQEVCSVLKALSFIRWYNDANSCGINFEIVKIPSMLDEDNALGCEYCLNFLLSNSVNSHVTVSVEDMWRFEYCHSDVICDLQLVRGHDMCEVICYMIKNFTKDGNLYYLKKTKLTTEKVEASLRLCYNKEKFSATKLYVALKDWFGHHNYQGMMAC